MTREQIYDSQVSPHMAAIMKLCQEHDIPFLAVFQIDEVRTKNANESSVCASAFIPPDASSRLKIAEEVAGAGSENFAARAKAPPNN